MPWWKMFLIRTAYTMGYLDGVWERWLKNLRREVMRLRRGTWASYMCLGMAIFLFLTLLPFVILGEWEHARRISVPLVALLLGWVLRKYHDEEKRARKYGRR